MKAPALSHPTSTEARGNSRTSGIRRLGILTWVVLCALAPLSAADVAPDTTIPNPQVSGFELGTRHQVPDRDLEPANPPELFSVTVTVAAGGAVARTPDAAGYAFGDTVTLVPVPAPGWSFDAWGGEAQGGDVPLVIVVTGNHAITAAFADTTAPSVQVEFPNDGGTLLQGAAAELRWSAADNDSVASVDLFLSRTGFGGDWEPIVLGAAPTGSYAWTVAGLRTTDAVLKVVARDRAGHLAEDLGDRTFSIKDVEDYPLLVLRADSAAGAGPHAVPGAANPWTDVARDHDATLWNFRGIPTGGWIGDGTPGSPYRLEFGNEDIGYENRVTIPAGSVPELQSLNPVTAQVWFKTGFNGTSSRYEYVLEWVERPAPVYDPEWEGRGMSIVVFDGKLQIYHNPWIEVMPVEPNTWYHVAVAKDTSEISVYVNGQRMYTGNKPHMGIQESEIVLGCATFRVFEGFPWPAVYSDYWTGAIAQMELWRGARSDSAIQAAFRADSALYLPNPPVTPLARVIQLRADLADGQAPYPDLSTTSPWRDLLPGQHDAILAGFNGDSTSGWRGDGSPESPYRLQFDGVDDVATIPAGSVPELISANAISAEAWIETGPDSASENYQQVLEWIEGFGSSPGLSLAIQDGQLQSYLALPYWVPIAPVEPNTRYHVVISKAPGLVRVFLNGQPVYSGITPNFGTPTSEIVIGASTWRGPGVYGEYFKGALLQVNLWRGALGDADVAAMYARSIPVRAETEALAPAPAAAPLGDLRIEGVHPNPATRPGRVSFVLPARAAATLDVIDVTGRRMRSVEVGSLGPGRHVVDLAGGGLLPAGNYLVRLSQEGRSVSTKATVLR